MVLKVLMAFLFLVTSPSFAAPDAECEAALKDLFASKVTKDEASDFLKVQGDLTLHRLAWAYLKAQKIDQTRKIESVEQTILSLLDHKFNSADPKFIRARNQFERQPLSRSALANIGPYLKEVLAHEFGADSKAFILNTSDLKLLGAISKFEKQGAVQKKFTMVNFAKLVNAKYRKTPTAIEEEIDVEVKLKGLERTIGSLQKNVNNFIKHLSVPETCLDDLECRLGVDNFSEIFSQNENVQRIFWSAMSKRLHSDDVLLEQLGAGKLWIGGRSSQQGNFTSSTGIYLQDPVGVILRDDPKRMRESYANMDPDYISKMVDTILNEDKVFVLDGKLYSRKTGRTLSTEAALEMLPPSKRVISKYSDSLHEQLAARINGDNSFIKDGTLYTVDGQYIEAASRITEELKKKKNLNIQIGQNKKMDKGYLVARVHALINNKPRFKFGSQIFDSETGKGINSTSRDLVNSVDAKMEKQRRVNYQNLSDAETIINFHRDFPKKEGCQYYSIIDKKNAEVTVYNLQGEVLFKREVLLGAKSSDKNTRYSVYNEKMHQGSYTTGAGEFTIGEPKKGSYYEENYNNNLLQIEDQSVFAIHQIPTYLGMRYKYFGTGNPKDRRVSGGCVNLKESDFLKLTKWMKPSCKVYVLPEEKHNRIVVKDNKIQLISNKPVTDARDYNYSSDPAIPRPIHIRITSSAGKTPESESFVKALEVEKTKLMKLLNLSNDEYNDLAAVAYGIMGNESKFGTSKKLWFKEQFPSAVVIGKAAKKVMDGNNPFVSSTTNLSKGFTQIKFLPDNLKSHYPEVTKDSLSNPIHSAIATIAYLADASKVLKKISAENKSDPRKVKITKENLVDYLGYVYQGRRSPLTSAEDPANADFNVYSQKLKKHMSYIEISQKIE